MAPGEALALDHAPFDALLRRFVVGDRVDYAGLAKERSALDAYVRSLAGTPASELSSRGPRERMAFWLNAYNAITLQQVVANYPLTRLERTAADAPASSIRQIPSVWDVKHAVAGRSLSLNDIEHAVLRKEFRDARIHFGLNCASVGCPPLRPEAFAAERLDAQLDEQARAFVADSRRNRIEPGRVQLSRIFEWFGEDFGGEQAFDGTGANPAAVLRFLVAHATGKAREVLAQATPAEVSYLDYDWQLNDAASAAVDAAKLRSTK